MRVIVRCVQCHAHIAIDDEKSELTCQACGAVIATADAVIEYFFCKSETACHKDARIAALLEKPCEVLSELIKELYETGTQELKACNWDNAVELFDKITRLAPDSYKGWFGLYKTKFHLYNEKCAKELKKVLSKANDEEAAKIQAIIADFKKVKHKDLVDKVDYYKLKVQETAAAYKDKNLFSKLRWLVLPAMIIPLAGPVLLGSTTVSYKRRVRRFLELCFYISKLERTFTENNFVFPAVAKKWNHEKLLVELPWLFEDLTPGALRKHIDDYMDDLEA